MLITPSFKKSLIAEQFQGNYLKCSASVVSQRIAIERKIALLEIRLFLKTHSLKFHEIWHENTLEISNWIIENNCTLTLDCWEWMILV